MLDFLELTLRDEIDRRENKEITTRLHRAGFDEAHPFEDFNWDASVTFDRNRLRDLFGRGLLDRHEDVLFLGPVGVCKTSLASAFGHSACRAGRHVLAEQKAWRRKLQRAYERLTYKEAQRDLMALRHELHELNQSAVASLDEGLEETLTLHQLGVFALVGRSLKTTNIRDSVRAQAEQRSGRQSLEELEPKAGLARRQPARHRTAAPQVIGHRHLGLLRAATILRHCRTGHTLTNFTG